MTGYYTHSFKGNTDPIYSVMCDLADQGYEIVQVDFDRKLFVLKKSDEYMTGWRYYSLCGLGWIGLFQILDWILN